MFEVATIASYLADHTTQEIDKKTIVETALLHDMGNIVKFKDFISPQMRMGEDYWRKIQKKFIDKYGEDAHQATLSIIKEINLTDEQPVVTLVTNNDFRFISENGYKSLESRICDFADMCVSPYGIVGFEKRMKDLIKRYKLEDDDSSTKTRKDNIISLKKYINLDLENIHHIDFTEMLKELSSYDISLKF